MILWLEPTTGWVKVGNEKERTNHLLLYTLLGSGSEWPKEEALQWFHIQKNKSKLKYNREKKVPVGGVRGLH